MCNFTIQPNENGVFKAKDDPDAVPQELQIMSLSDACRLLDQFRDQCQGAYLQAINEQVHSLVHSYTHLFF